MTKQELHIFLEALRYFIEESNDMVADDDRGRANDALCLVLFEDGSGSINTTGSGPASQLTYMNPQCKFATIEQAVDYLADWMIEQAETHAVKERREPPDENSEPQSFWVEKRYDSSKE